VGVSQTREWIDCERDHEWCAGEYSLDGYPSYDPNGLPYELYLEDC
jgi:hypothetical protein